MMTRADLFNWLQSYGCTFKPIQEYKANVILVENPQRGLQYWINLPIDDRPVKDFTVYKTCMSLCVPIPTHVAYMEDVANKIEEEDKIQKRKRR
jgi:hypothetical protein